MEDGMIDEKPKRPTKGVKSTVRVPLSKAFTFKDWQMENRKQYETDETEELYQKFLWMALSSGYLVCKGELQQKLRRLHELEKRYAEEQT
tara:strand:+ start:31 stop:300 length:270 start_codon:yes stop_codon:yes gene_type:complete